MPEEKEIRTSAEDTQADSGREAAATGAVDVESLKKQLEQEKEKAESYLANWQRAQADFINYKRRIEQEKGDLTRFSNAMLILNLLPVLDDMERALATVPTAFAGLTWLDGLRLIYRKLLAILESQGLQPIEAEGKDFDPNLHEAVMHTEGEDGKVLQELQRGYKLHDRVVRPAMVTVGKKSVESGDKQEEGS
ncbi:MAG: nucleotide exchange factor GrpE [Dehalococcoidia bacterium]|nr:nucleotide exchange factor GrpE [Dehalococcoidia bacterium]